jgi:hypothetical protein
VALDAAGSLGFANGAFEESVEEIPEVFDEFYPEAGGNGGEGNGGNTQVGTNAVTPKSKVTLKDKLDKKATDLRERTA